MRSQDGLKGDITPSKVQEIAQTEEKLLSQSSDDAISDIRSSTQKCRGLYLHYFLQSLFKQFINGTNYAFFVRYLNSPGHMSTAVRSFWNVLWTFKFVFAIMSDILPICSLKRKPYIILGWCLSFCGIILACLVPFPDSHFAVEEINGTCSVSGDLLNPQSTEYVLIYVLLLGLAKFGVAIMDCSADGRLVEITRSEPTAKRGSAVAIGHLMQKIGVFGTSIVIILSLNSPEYGGSFCFGLSFDTLLVCFAFVPVVALFITLLCVEEPPVRPGDKISAFKWLEMLWKKLQESAFIRIAAFVFFYVFAYNFRSPARVSISRNWANVSPMANAVFGIISLLLHSVGVVIYKQCLLKVSWRYLVFFGFIFCTAPNIIVEYMTIFDIWRNEYFYFTDDVLEAIPEGILYIIIMQVSSEICGRHFEGSVFAIMMSVYTISIAFARSLSNLLGSFFDVSYSERFLRDNEKDRFAVFASVLAAYAVKFVLLPLILLLLPRQRDHLSSLAKKSKASSRNAIIFVVVLSSAIAYSMVTSLLAVNSRTSCLSIAGGKGC